MRRPRRQLNLDAMSLAELLQLRDEIRTALSGKIQMERRELQSKIDELARLKSGSDDVNSSEPSVAKRGRSKTARKHLSGNRRTIRAGHALAGRKVEPKYRDPANPAQTWAGRGQVPRWLKAYEAAGRKRKTFRSSQRCRQESQNNSAQIAIDNLKWRGAIRSEATGGTVSATTVRMALTDRRHTFRGVTAFTTIRPEAALYAVAIAARWVAETPRKWSIPSFLPLRRGGPYYARRLCPRLARCGLRASSRRSRRRRTPSCVATDSLQCVSRRWPREIGPSRIGSAVRTIAETKTRLCARRPDDGVSLPECEVRRMAGMRQLPTSALDRAQGAGLIVFRQTTRRPARKSGLILP